MKRSLSLKAIAGLLGLLAVYPLPPLDAAESKPNLILIIADDMACEDCGPYGHPFIRTPNLDRLARDGMRFEWAFLTCSSCSPSRSSIITGRYPHNTGAEQLHWPLPKEQITFVEKLREAGYWTAAVGKWHLGGAVKDRFDLVREAGKPRPGQDRDESGCAEWIPTLRDRPKDRPFFLWLASLDPHRDYRENAIARPHRPEDVIVPPYLPDVPETRKDLALYYDEISRLDSNVGKVLAELERQKLTDNTVILFISDNGRPFPRCKTTVYDSGIRTPLLVRWPEKVNEGSICLNLVSAIDFAPTFLELAGVKPGPSFQGVSIVPLLKNPRSRVREHIFAEHNWHDYEARSRAVRDGRYRYIRNDYPDLPNTPPADAVKSITFQAMRRLRDAGKLTAEQKTVFTKPLPAEELYDTQADPHELHNLAGDPKYAPKLAILRETLGKWCQETGDKMPVKRTPDEFDRETGKPLPDRKHPRVQPRP